MITDRHTLTHSPHSFVTVEELASTHLRILARDYEDLSEIKQK